MFAVSAFGNACLYCLQLVKAYWSHSPMVATIRQSREGSTCHVKGRIISLKPKPSFLSFGAQSTFKRISSHCFHLSKPSLFSRIQARLLFNGSAFAMGCGLETVEWWSKGLSVTVEGKVNGSLGLCRDYLLILHLPNILFFNYGNRIS